MYVTTKAAALLRAAVGRMQEEPRRADMNYFLVRHLDQEPGMMADMHRGPDQIPPCGTVGCIAGWIVADTPYERGTPYGPSRTAAEMLGLDVSETHSLFYLNIWPPNFQRQLAATTSGTRAYVQVIADRVEHFIETGV